MPFAQRRPLPPPEAGQSIFSGREKEISLYRLHFHRPKDHPQVRLITALSGPGGVGKTRLLDELEWFRPAETVYSRISGSADLGHDATDATHLLRALADGLHREGEPIPTPKFDQRFRHRQNLLEKALTRSLDTKQVLRHYYRPALLGLPADSPAISPNLDQFADLRWPRNDLMLAFENPIGLLTQALVEDLNQIGEQGAGNKEQETERQTDADSQSAIRNPQSAISKIVLIFDDFDRLSPVVGEWLLTHLLGHSREAITCDLRLVIAARDDLTRIDSRWAEQWDELILPLKLQPFDAAELTDFVRKNSYLTDPAAVAKVSEATTALPLWLNLWLAGGADPTATGSGVELGNFSEQQLGWLQQAALAGTFDQPRLAVLLGDDEGREAFQWLISRQTLVKAAGGNGQFALDRTLAAAIRGNVDAHNNDSLRTYLDHQLELLRADLLRVTTRSGHSLTPARRKEDDTRITIGAVTRKATVEQPLPAPLKIRANWRAVLLERARLTPANESSFLPGAFLEALNEYPPLMFDLLALEGSREQGEGRKEKERTGEAAGKPSSPQLPAIAETWLTGTWADLPQPLNRLRADVPLTAAQQAIACDWLAYAIRINGDPVAAIDAYSEGLQHNNQHAPLYVGRGLAYLMRAEGERLEG